jgi:hypothetical protein
MLDHYQETKHPIAMDFSRRSFWCFNCETSQVHQAEDPRVQIAYGLAMTPSEEDRSSIASLLRRFHRQGRPHPREWSDLPAHRRAVFGSRGAVNLYTLASLWKRGIVGKKIVVMVGAGISVNAGIPDFRSPKIGLYSKIASNDAFASLTRPEDVFSLEIFRKNQIPFFTVLRGMWQDLERSRPTKTHCFLKLLESQNMLKRLYTQNIDGLETACGICEDKIVECHGTLSNACCIDCKKSFDVSIMRREIMKSD